MIKSILILILALPAMAAVTTGLSNLQRQIEDQARLQWAGKAEIKVTDIHVREAIPEKARVSAIFPNPAMGVVNYECNWEEKGLSRQTMGTATVRVNVPVAVTTRTIERGGVIEKALIRFESRELSRYQQTGYFLTEEDLVGKTAKVTLRAGTVVGPNLIEDVLAVSQGQLVELVHGTRAVTISTRVKALENGRIGNWVRAENISSRRPLRVRVTAPGEVRLK